ncbi:pyrin domain-containing protein 1-like [Dermochelys coriacea]|uniref:pyrin domain-containing protein 1-like n=1 Tax=Dermochelys coriacea TaxID=27794 RepID=UPI001CAA1DBF|nr:pyrin domain-containing protein 1-like [Dermochelys coriacea]
MGKTVRDHLVDTLEELGQDELKRFKAKLNAFPVKEGYSNIPLRRLEKADVLDVCDKLISYYREEYAVEVTVKLLTDINERDLADRLCKATGTGKDRGRERALTGIMILNSFVKCFEIYG